MQAKTDFSPRFNGRRAGHAAPCTDAARPGVFDCQSAALGRNFASRNDRSSPARTARSQPPAAPTISRLRRMRLPLASAQDPCRGSSRRSLERIVARALTRLILRVATSSRFIVESPPGGAAREQFSNSPVGDGPVTASERPAPRGNQIDVRICLDCRRGPARSQ